MRHVVGVLTLIESVLGTAAEERTALAGDHAPALRWQLTTVAKVAVQ